MRILHSRHDSLREQPSEPESKPHGGEIRTALSGNLCRCTGYQKIVEAVQSIGESAER